VLVLLGAFFGPAGCGRAPRPDALIRVDQVGYLTGETKIAMLLAPRDATGATGTVVDAAGNPVGTAAIGRSRGQWNTSYAYVHPIDLTAVTRPGTYRIRVSGAVTAESPPFRIGTGTALFGPLVDNAVRYFQAHRDGADQVDGPWQRPPAHLSDRQATVYDPPGFHDDGTVDGSLTPAGADPVDVEGGWYDAGDYLKFTHTTAYALILMLLTQRDGPPVPGLAAEIGHGLDWLDKMWDAGTGTLYTQVGIGSGQDFLGDHDTWRLPQADDLLDVSPGDPHYYQRYRPVFRAAGPGEALSPNLAGRVAAAFALAAQVEAASDPAAARRHLTAAAQIFDLAETTDVGQLVTTEPFSFYPEASWHDDLAAGATELALAGAALHDPREQGWTMLAAHWAKANADDGGTDPLSVYDLSTVADAELARRLTAVPLPGAEIGVDGLRADLRQRLTAGVRAAAANPMGAAAGNGGSDYAAQQLGYAATAALYRRATGDGRFAAFGTAQLGIALGANGWGTSLVVGAGSTYPRCPHDQIANLTRGPEPLTMVGAVVNGPNAAARVRELAQATRPSTCRVAVFKPFNRTDEHYTDNVGVSATTEPAIDFTATGLYAFALESGQESRG
jgi:endoglucanase